jgi:hypothetical protein
MAVHLDFVTAPADVLHDSGKHAFSETEARLGFNEEDALEAMLFEGIHDPADSILFAIDPAKDDPLGRDRTLTGLLKTTTKTELSVNRN